MWRRCAVETRAPFYSRIDRANAADQMDPMTATHSLREAARSNVTRVLLCRILQVKNAAGQDCGPHLQEKCRTPGRDTRFVPACAVEMHMDMSQEPFHTDIYCTGKMPRPRTCCIGNNHSQCVELIVLKSTLGVVGHSWSWL